MSGGKPCGASWHSRCGRRRRLRGADHVGFAERHTVPRCVHAPYGLAGSQRGFVVEMPNAECRMPNAECRMPNAECSTDGLQGKGLRAEGKGTICRRLS